MSVSNLYATASNGSKFIKQDKIEVDNLIVDTTLTINGGTVINDGITIFGRDNANAELNMNFDANALDCIGSTTGLNFETIDKELGSVICENSSATAGSVIASKISIKPAIPNGATPVISDMLSVGKDLLTTEVGVFAKTAFGAGIAGALGITNVEDYLASSAGKAYKFTLPIVGGNDNLSLVADQIAPIGFPGSAPSVVSSKTVLSVKPVGPTLAPTNYDLYLGDTSVASPNVLVEGSGGSGRVFDSLYNVPNGMVLPSASDFSTPATGANPNITITAPFCMSGPVVVNSGLLIPTQSTNFKAGPYMVQVVITVDNTANTVITPGEFFRLDIYDNIAPENRYYAGVLVIPSDDLKVPTAPTNTLYPTNTYVYTTVVWFSGPSPTFDPYIQFYLQSDGTASQTSKLPNAQISIFPMTASF